MSTRVVGYEGEGRTRRPIYVDEGPASVRVDGDVGMGRASLIAGIPDRELTGGAGAIERRQITEAERVVRAEVRPSGIPDAVRRPKHTSPAVVQEEPVPEPRADHADPIPAAADALSDLAEAVVGAIEARDAKAIADAAWQIAQRGLAAAWRAMPPLDLIDAAPRSPESSAAEVRHERLLMDPVAPVRPNAGGGRATAEQLQTSRRNGQAAMQAQRRAVELNREERIARDEARARAAQLTSAAAAKGKAKATTTQKGTTGQTRTPEQRERMRQGQLASIERRKAAAAQA